MEDDDMTLSAFIDGELSPEQQADFERRLSVDKRLAARANLLRDANRLVANAVREIDDAPFTPSVKNTIDHLGANKKTDTIGAAPARHTRRADEETRGHIRRHSIWHRPDQMAALAASLIVGVLLGGLPGLFRSPSTIGPDSSPLVVAEVIDEKHPYFGVLNAAPSGRVVETPAGSLTPVLTFQSVNGDICREFLLTQERQSAQGVACLEAAEWKTKLIVFSNGSFAGGSRFEAASDHGSIDISGIVSAMMDGDAFSSNREADFLNRSQ